MAEQIYHPQYVEMQISKPTMCLVTLDSIASCLNAVILFVSAGVSAGRRQVGIFRKTNLSQCY